MLAKFGNPWVTGTVMAGLFAAGMSSFAAVSIIAGTAFVGDIWTLFKPMPQKKQVSFTKWVMWIYSAIIFIITLYPPAGIVELTAFAGAVFTAGFFPAVFGGLYLRWGTGKGVLWSMIIGIATTLIWRFGLRFYLPGMKDIHEVLPGFIVSLIVYLIVSKLTSSDIPDKEHLDHVFHTQES